MRDNACERMVPLPANGRTFSTRRRVYVGDADPAGLLRLDALARYVQDVAGDDTADVGLFGPGWVVRRTVVETVRPPRFREELTVTTWCSGTGRCWAERRVRLVGSEGGEIDVAVLWVHVDMATGRPTRLPEEFMAVYGTAAQERSVTARLRHEPPGPTAADGAATDAMPWPLRAVDFDVLSHVNNAATWAVAEELIARRIAAGESATTVRTGRAELEYPGALELGEVARLVVRSDEACDRAWLVAAPGLPSATGDDVRASVLLCR